MKRLQAECNAHLQNADALKAQYEALTAELQEQVRRARLKASEGQKVLQDREKVIKELEASLSVSKAELRTAHLTFAAAEEKRNREKSLIEGQTKLQCVNLAAAQSRELEALRSQLEKRNRAFLVQICEKFKDFMNLSQQITEASILDMLSCVLANLRRLEGEQRELKTHVRSLDDIRAVLNLPKEADLVLEIQQLHGRQVRQPVTVVQNDPEAVQNLRSWELWGKRVCAMITDGFSGQKTDKDLQFAIEECLISAIGQRLVWRRMEILRFEKQFLQPYFRCQRKKWFSFSGVGLAVSAVMRLQKLSGHLHTDLRFTEAILGSVSSRAPSHSPSETRPKFSIFNIE
jgi:hypothetical protein